MISTLLPRILISLGLIILGWGGYRLANWFILGRVSRNQLGLESFVPGRPAILYFTTPTCMPCKTVQRPALSQLKTQLGSSVQIIQVDAVERPDLADYWGVLSVPTTFIIDSSGEPRLVNHGVASTDKLLGQLEKIEGKSLTRSDDKQDETQARVASQGVD